MAEVDDVANALLKCKNDIKRRDIASPQFETLAKRGISVDGFLTPSSEKDLKRIKYYSGSINDEIKNKFLRFLAVQYKEQVEFSKHGYSGTKWHTNLSKYLKSVITNKPIDSGGESTDETSGIKVAKELIDKLENTYEIKFLESEFALFGFMRDRATDGKKIFYLWRGIADAIAYSAKLKKYIIVDFKVINNLSDYWQSKTDLIGKHLHQCLVYARLLQLHMNLEYLPPIMIAVIDGFTGKEGFFPLFEDYPEECKEKLKNKWFKLPLKMVKNDEMADGVYDDEVPLDTPLNEIFKETAKVRDLLEALHLDYDALDIA